MKTIYGFELTVAVLFLAIPAAAQQHDAHHGAQKPPVAVKAPEPGKSGSKAAHAGMSSECAKMMQMHQRDESTTKQQDAKLKKLTTAMNRASGNQKVNAMSAVITELVSQRNARQTMNSERRSQMMGHMMQHMGNKGKMDPGGKMPLMQCPMMTSAGSSQSGMGHMGNMGHMGGMMKKNGK